MHIKRIEKPTVGRLIVGMHLRQVVGKKIAVRFTGGEVDGGVIRLGIDGVLQGDKTVPTVTGRAKDRCIRSDFF